MDDIGSMPSNKYLDPKTQFVLFTAGVRGAVSYALVQNIPVYDAVTKHGSHFKGELRAMTSVTIVGLLFVFGALTYFAVDRTPTPLQLNADNRLADSLVSPSNEYAPPGSGHFGDNEHDLHSTQMNTEFEESQTGGQSMQRFG
jgi:hypothetical protein